MKRVAIALALIILFVITGQANAADSSVRFTDHAGKIWQRWVLTEQQDERTLLLVVEKPIDTVRSVSQRVVYRHSFALGSTELSLRQDRFMHLKDRSESVMALDLHADSFDRAAHQPIWALKQDHWTPQDERRYTAWIQNTVTEKFLQGSGLIVDCADLSLTLRWIYAHDNGLPAANTLGGSGGLFGQWSGTAAWDQLATNSDWRQDARFKAALRYLLNSAYTHTILNDLYPTEISREYVTPGSIRLTITDVQSGHTQIVHHVGHDQTLCPDGQCVSVFYGDTPASETIFDDVAWLLNLKKGYGGFMRWRWPQVSASGKWSLSAATSMAGYSLEQFSHPTFTTEQYQNYFNMQLFWSTTLTDRATTLGYSLIASLNARLQVTAMAHALCYQENCAPNSSLYDDYATPVRDQRYLAAQARFIDLVTNDAVDTTASEYQALLKKAQQPIFAGGGLTYADYIFDRGGLNEALNPDPSRPFVERWGLLTTTAADQQWAQESLWETLWVQRETQIAAAQATCFANGATKPTCAPSSSAIKALATDELDRALRVGRQVLQAERPKLDATTQSQLARWASTQTTRVTGQAFCKQTPSGRCLILDFIYSSLNAVSRMSSAPTDDLQDRYGL